MNNENKTAFVFVHGLLGFSERGFSRFSVAYFRGLKKSLSDLSANIYFPALPATGTIKNRAAVLAQFIDKIEADNICLIGHSMGGLDSRFYTTHLDKKHRVKQVITIATPHHGTPLASWVINKTNILYAVLNKITAPAIAELTPEAAEQFNATVLDRSDVYYASYAASRSVDELPLWFRNWARKLSAVAGENDSQVPVESAKWGEFSGVLHADHIELVGWSLGFSNKKIERPFNRLLFYRKILESALVRF